MKVLTDMHTTECMSWLGQIVAFSIQRMELRMEKIARARLDTRAASRGKGILQAVPAVQVSSKSGLLLMQRSLVNTFTACNGEFDKDPETRTCNVEPIFDNSNAAGPFKAVTFSKGDKYGSDATFTCTDGFILSGSSTITCGATQMNDTWPTPPHCIGSLLMWP